MDELLEQRYLTLFRIYGAGGSDLLVRAKRSIYDALERRVLRADAALFLVANVDHMLLRPYAEYVPAADGQPIRVSEEFRDPESVGQRVDEALGTILNNLEGDGPHSAHAVINAVEASWRELSLSFLWA
jgi:hypothetical protein